MGFQRSGQVAQLVRARQGETLLEAPELPETWVDWARRVIEAVDR